MQSGCLSLCKGHFDRVNDAVYDMLEKQKKLTRESIERQAEDFHVCPFELSLDLSEWADGVICDYNYVFDPTAHLKRFLQTMSAEIICF